MDKLFILDLFKRKIPLEEISNLSGISKDKIKCILLELGVKKSKLITKEDIMYVSANSNSAAEASRILGINYKTYKRLALEYGCFLTNQGLKNGSKIKKDELITYKYKMNEKAFDNWNYEMAYWLGFIAADGSVSSSKNRISIGLSITDKKQLENFREFLSSNHPILEYSTNKNDVKNACSINIYSKHLRNKLIELGIVPRKSYNNIDFLMYVPDKFKVPFLIGNFDGDGSITSKNYNITFLGSEKFMKSCSYYLNKKIGINWTNLYMKTENCYVLNSGRKDEVIKFCNLYYEWSSLLPVMSRKLGLIKNAIDRYN